MTGSALRRRVLAVVGTRPDAIKMAPVIRALRATALDTRVCSTSQHGSLLQHLVRLFEIQVDFDLGPMQEDQDLAGLTSRLVIGLSECMKTIRPDAVVAQGDTTTALACALVAFYQAVPFFHVEAGLRTYDPTMPYPEEINRQLISRIASLHFAPTRIAADALRREGVPDGRIFETGNTGIDALLAARDRVAAAGTSPPGDGRVTVLVTLHRRESFGAPLRRICAAIASLADRRPELRFVIPVHPNPAVGKVVRETLAARPSIVLLEPLGYLEFVEQMISSHVILTDSGGVQEEAPVLGKPVLVARDTTERTEAVAAGVARLVGSETQTICREVERLLDDPSHYARMARGGMLFGDGRASERISEAIGRFWNT